MVFNLSSFPKAPPPLLTRPTYFSTYWHTKGEEEGKGEEGGKGGNEVGGRLSIGGGQERMDKRED
jgi:hypothetical protein